MEKFSHARFEPSGMTKNPEVRFAKSIVDYIFRWMATKFPYPEVDIRRMFAEAREELLPAESTPDEDAPPCSTCGAIMKRSGSLYKCANCGTTTALPS